MDSKTFRAVLARAFWVPAVVAFVLAAILIGDVQFLVNQAGWVDHTDKVITVAERIYRQRVDEETGLRAYLLTRDERFLQPLYEARGKSLETRNELQKLIADNPAQQQKDAAALVTYNEWLGWADDTVARAKAGENVDTTAIQLRGKELMDRYRMERSAFIAEEERLREARALRSLRTIRMITASIVGICVLSAWFLIIFARRQLAKLFRAFTQALTEVERKAAELGEQKNWLRTTLTSIGDAVIATDSEGAVTLMNPVAATLTGWKAEEAQGRALKEVFRIVNEQSRNPVEDPVDKVRRLNRIVGLANHTVLISRTGHEYLIDDSGAPIRDAAGAISGIVVVFRDVTQQRALESGLRSNERLAAAGRLSASIAHEIHNPLDTVVNLLFLISTQTPADSKVQAWIAAAQNELHRVVQISKNMLRLHRDSRQPTTVQVFQLLENVAELIRGTIAKGRTIELNHKFEGTIEGFSSDLFQVFTNILRNAVEATTEGGTITISSQAVTECGEQGVLIEVRDNGVGIPPDLQGKLFTPFVSTKGDAGTGLGLWVSRSFVERHGGTIRVSSRNDSGADGAIASVFLPLTVKVDESSKVEQGQGA